MKNVIFFSLTAMLMGGCDHNHAPAAPESNAMTQEFYGDSFDVATSIPASAIAAQLEGKDTLFTTIDGVIDQTCPNAGCWMNMKLDSGIQKITTDHVFFVPLEGCEGLKAKAKGKAFYDEISVEMLKHYAQEEGKTEAEVAAITEPKKVLNFVATGVMIEGYTEPEGGAKQGSCNHDHGDGEHHDHDHEHEHEGEQHEEKGGH
jgi:hypothetical protein